MLNHLMLDGAARGESAFTFLFYISLSLADQSWAAAVSVVFLLLI